MRRFAGFGMSALLLLLLGAAVPTYAFQGQQPQHPRPQEKRQEKAKKNKGEKNKKQPRATQQQRRQQPASQRPAEQGQRQRQRPQAEQPRAPQRRQPVNRPSQRRQHVQPREQRAVWQRHRARNWESQHRTWRQRGGYHGYRIPAVHYRAYFGPSHRFRIYGQPLVVVGGYPRFQYGGYWISFLDPWPQFWPYDWYETDQVYLVFVDGGYYLVNVRYPRYRIAVAIYLR